MGRVGLWGGRPMGSGRDYSIILSLFPSLMSRGWVIGTHGWRQALARDYAHRALTPGLEAKELAQLKAFRCETELAKLLHAAGMTEADARADFYSASWKVAIAAALRQNTSASNRWIAEKLHMGAANSVSQYLSRMPHARSL